MVIKWYNTIVSPKPGKPRQCVKKHDTFKNSSKHFNKLKKPRNFVNFLHFFCENIISGNYLKNMAPTYLGFLFQVLMKHKISLTHWYTSERIINYKSVIGMKMTHFRPDKTSMM